MFAAAKIASAQKWSATNQGQHIELGIAESNLFLMLAALGLAGDLFDHRLFPIGTLYDPFIARGLDSLNYACYQDARFLLVATSRRRSGRRRRAPVDQPAADRARPTRLAPLRAGLRRRAGGDDRGGFRLIDAPDGESTTRLSTRNLRQVERGDDGWKADALAGGYWLREPGDGAEAAIVAMGAVMPEALAAWEELSADFPALACSPSPSPDLLHRGWSAARRRAGRAGADRAMSSACLSRLAPAPGS